jgi:hypothetical protein
MLRFDINASEFLKTLPPEGGLWPIKYRGLTGITTPGITFA